MSYPYLASRIFGVPLLIERHKLDVILAAIAPRLGIEAPTVEVYGPGDKGKERKSYYVTEDNIAVIDIVGPLVKRQSGEFLSGGPTTYAEIENEFMDAATDPNIAGILFQIDSPGGESVGAMELSDLIYSARGNKPIFASADGDAFSAAYALASAADRVYVTKSGGVGSVGVWMMHVDQSGFNSQKGLKPTYLFAGARKIDGNPHEPLTDEAREVFQSEVDRTYNMFVGTVARNRNLSESTVRKTEAALFFGSDAVTAGLADEVGTLSSAFAALRATVQSSSRMAASAAHKSPGGKPNMADTTEPADNQTPAPEQQPPAAETAQEARAAALAYAVDVAELCCLAGMPARAAAFIQAGRPIAEVRQELQAARAEADAATEIHSHTLPETAADSSRQGGANTDVENSPLVKAATRLAQTRKEQQ